MRLTTLGITGLNQPKPCRRRIFAPSKSFRSTCKQRVFITWGRQQPQPYSPNGESHTNRLAALLTSTLTIASLAVLPLLGLSTLCDAFAQYSIVDMLQALR